MAVMQQTSLFESEEEQQGPTCPLCHSPVRQLPDSQFADVVAIGQQLMWLHLHYEQALPFPLRKITKAGVPISYRVEKMRLSDDKTSLFVNETLTLAGIPLEVYEYRLGDKSALEWVIDQYQVTTDKRSGLVSDPNNQDDEEYIVRLVCQVVAVSLETVRLTKLLDELVAPEDWLSAEEIPLQG
jgi:predicted helicase